jgi:GNAT superfamily N-acetyltransferase
VFTAVGPDESPVGFAAATPVGGFLHLAELSVDPVHGRIGVGRALIEAVDGLARRSGLAGVTLTTFRDVPFNAPFYAGLGFAEMPLAAAPDALRRQFHAELPPHSAVEARILMLRRC